MNWLDFIPAWTAGGVGAGGGFFAIKWLVEYVGGRLDKREAALDAQTQELIDNLRIDLNTLRSRLDDVDAELRECRKQHTEASFEIARLTGLIQARGEMRDKAAVFVAAERLKDRENDQPA